MHPTMTINQKEVEKNINHVIHSMDFISRNYLASGKKKFSEKLTRTFFDIYQHLGVAWHYWGLMCRHRKGYRNTRDGYKVCRICGKTQGVPDCECLLPAKGPKVIGQYIKTPSSKIKSTKNEKEATIVNDTISFHGAKLKVRVHHCYPSKILKNGKKQIMVAAGREVELLEKDVKISLDDFLLDLELISVRRKDKKQYGGFAFELSKKLLKKFPILYNYGPTGKFHGVTIFLPIKKKGKKR